MKPINIKSCLEAGAVSFSLLLGGCISLPNSPISPTPRFYMLSAKDETLVNKIINITPGVIIGVGPVKIPEYLDRPQMVTKDKEGILKFDEFNRWGQSLDLGLASLIREDLTVMLPGAKMTLYPWNPLVSVKYQVVLEVVQMDNELDKDMLFVVQWTVIDVQNSKTVMIKRSEFHQPIIPQNYPGLVKTLSSACASLSGQIAEALASLDIKGNDLTKKI
jgi:uncharacterized lipoprotein YmbA